MFIDEAEIYVRAGKGGQGCVSFRREKFVPKGGPDGGDGGDGGSVSFVTDRGRNTLLDFARRREWIAENGRPGAGANRNGRKGKSLRVRVPVGTLIIDRDSGALLKDLCEEDQEVCIVKGGRGGHGNRHFATPTNQAPRECEPGEPGEERRLLLQLKLIADVGLVGLPNAGKSTLLSRLSRAKPKIASYPFTTLEPQLGIVELSGFRRFVMADIPGLIEGAHRGVGLGDAFLKHIERTRVLVHLVDLCPLDGTPNPGEAYRMIREELAGYSEMLLSKREVIVANKTDLTDSQVPLREIREELGREVLGISAVTGAGLEVLTEHLWEILEADRRSTPARPAPLVQAPAPHLAQTSPDEEAK
jgi:GTP-binding protein